MMPRVRCRSPLAAVAVLLPGLLTTAIMTGSRVAAEALPAARAADEAAIRAAAKTYVDALDKGDAAALAALWTPDGDIIDAGGHVMAGRAALSLYLGIKPKDTFNFIQRGSDSAVMHAGTNECLVVIMPMRAGHEAPYAGFNRDFM